MTALVEPATEVTAPVPVVAVPIDAPPHPSSAARRRHAVVAVGVAVFLFVVVLWVFEGPMAHVWYQSRQQNLAVDMAAQRKQDRKGEATAILQIPSINLDVVVVQGDGPAQLRGGPGHRIGTPPAGARGNSLVFGHRSGWGGAFSQLSKLHPRDNIVVSNRTALPGPTGNLPVLFQVVSVQRVRAGDTRLLAPSTDHRLTLVTSSGDRFSSERLIVVAVSGTLGHLVTTAKVAPDSPHGSDLFNATTGLLVVLVGGGALIARQLRGSHRRSMVVAMMAPLALAAVLAVLLEVDLAAFPLLR